MLRLRSSNLGCLRPNSIHIVIQPSPTLLHPPACLDLHPWFLSLFLPLDFEPSGALLLLTLEFPPTRHLNYRLPSHFWVLKPIFLNWHILFNCFIYVFLYLISSVFSTLRFKVSLNVLKGIIIIIIYCGKSKKKREIIYLNPWSN